MRGYRQITCWGKGEGCVYTYLLSLIVIIGMYARNGRIRNSEMISYIDSFVGSYFTLGIAGRLTAIVYIPDP